MLVITRKVDQRIKVGENIWISVVDIRGSQIRIGVEAPSDVPIYREETVKAVEAAKNEN